MRTPLITLLNADCLPAMREMGDNQFELAIVDPPYGININMNMGVKKNMPKTHVDKNWDNTPPHDEYFIELLRVSQNQIIWGGNYFRLPLVRGWIFWDKSVPAGVSFADGELAWTSFDVVLAKADVPYSGFVGSEGKIHPTQKPVALYKWLLRNYAKEGDAILDTHGGSMSLAIACHDYGFDLTCFELDAEYYATAVKRLNDHRSQMKLDL